MCTIDLIIAVCFLPAIYFGIKNGLVRQLISLCVVYFGIKLAVRFSLPVSTWLEGHVGVTEFWSKTISFILIFLGVALILSIIGRAIDKIIKISLLGWLNRLLGVVLSFLIFGLVIASAIHLLDHANNLFHFISEEKVAESKLVPLLLDLTENLFSKFF